MKALWKNVTLPRGLEGASDAKVEMSFMERGSFAAEFSKPSFLGNGAKSSENSTQIDEFSMEEDRARMM